MGCYPIPTSNLRFRTSTPNSPFQTPHSNLQPSCQAYSLASQPPDIQGGEQLATGCRLLVAVIQTASLSRHQTSARSATNSHCSQIPVPCSLVRGWQSGRRRVRKSNKGCCQASLSCALRLNPSLAHEACAATVNCSLSTDFCLRDCAQVTPWRDAHPFAETRNRIPETRCAACAAPPSPPPCSSSLPC